MLKGSHIGKKAQEFTGAVFSKIPLSPNQITALSVIFALIGFAFSIRHDFVWAVILFALSVFCDLADGAIARAKNMVSKKGGFLDGIADRIVEFFMLSSLLFYSWPIFILPMTFWIVILLFFGSAMTTFVSSYAYLKGLADKEESPGALARPERVSMILAAYVALAISNTVVAVLIIVLAAMLAMGTACTRFIYFWLKKEN